MTEEEKNLVYNIAWLRQHHGLSKRKMAKVLGIGTLLLTRIENGELPSRFGGSALIRIYPYFGICIDDLLRQRLFKD